ncbi:MAG: ABC transporter permease [Clostridiales bacterium]|nr:ABC transporter permease [Clostridiales bacterium]
MAETTRSRLLRFFKDNNIVFILILVYAAACVAASPMITSGKSNNFIKLSNTLNILQNIGTYGILAMGLTFIFLVGGIDLSIGYQVGFDGALFAILATHGVNLWLAMLITVAAGLLIGYTNGLIVTRMRITPLIGTLAVMTILKGLVYLINSESISLTDVTVGEMSLKAVYTSQLLTFLSLPVILIIILTAAAVYFLKKTRSGVNLYIIGGNLEAGNLAGINSPGLTRLAYTIGGGCASICAILVSMRMNAATYNMGDGIDITAICAIVVGGVKMKGGKGNMLMCIMGVAVIQIIANLMDKLHFSSAMISLITGIIVVLVLILDKFTGRKEAM